MNKTFIISEIGINHNGDLDIAKKMIDASIDAGADAVKFQKRDIDIVLIKSKSVIVCWPKCWFRVPAHVI